MTRGTKRRRPQESVPGLRRHVVPDLGRGCHVAMKWIADMTRPNMTCSCSSGRLGIPDGGRLVVICSSRRWCHAAASPIKASSCLNRIRSRNPWSLETSANSRETSGKLTKRGIFGERQGGQLGLSALVVAQTGWYFVGYSATACMLGKYEQCAEGLKSLNGANTSARVRDTYSIRTRLWNGSWDGSTSILSRPIVRRQTPAPCTPRIPRQPANPPHPRWIASRKRSLAISRVGLRPPSTNNRRAHFHSTQAIIAPLISHHQEKAHFASSCDPVSPCRKFRCLLESSPPFQTTSMRQT